MKDGFEWGADGDSVATSGGGITWTTSGTPVRISTDRAYVGTRALKWTGTATQYAQTAKAAGYGYDITVRYYKVTGGNTIRPIQHGDATHRFRLFIQGNGRICCYTGAGMQYYTIHALDAWHKLAVKHLDWLAATFDIYVDDLLEVAGVPMEVSGATNGIFQATTEDNTSGVPWYLDEFEIGKAAPGGNLAGKLVAARLI